MNIEIAAAVSTALTELLKDSLHLRGNSAKVLAVLVAIVVAYLQDAVNGVAAYATLQLFLATFLRGLVMGLTLAGLYAVGDHLATKAGQRDGRRR